MGKLISIQSAKGGSGATTLLMNLAAVLAQDGKQVCMVDACFDPYVFGLTFNIEQEEIKFSLNDFIYGKCQVEDTLIKLPEENMFLVLSSMKIGEQARILREGYDVGLLNDGLSKLAESFDYILLDTGSTLAEEMLLVMAVSDIVVINSDWKYLTKPAVFIELAKKLDVPKIFMVLNLVPKKVFEIPVSEFRNNFNQPMALIPNSTDIRDELGIFAIAKPNHPITGLFRKIARHILDDKLPGGNMVVSVEESEVGTLFSELDVKASMSERKLGVFLSYSSLDKSVVQDLYQKLLFEGWIDPWLDNEKLLPGQNRQMETEKAMEATDAVIVFLSNNSVNREGSIQKELRNILEISQEKPEGEIFLIPVRLDNCEIPRNFSQLQWADYSEETAYQKIKKALQYRFQNLSRMRS